MPGTIMVPAPMKPRTTAMMAPVRLMVSFPSLPALPDRWGRAIMTATISANRIAPMTENFSPFTFLYSMGRLPNIMPIKHRAVSNR